MLFSQSVSSASISSVWRRDLRTGAERADRSNPELIFLSILLILSIQDCSEEHLIGLHSPGVSNPAAWQLQRGSAFFEVRRNAKCHNTKDLFAGSITPRDMDFSAAKADPMSSFTTAQSRRTATRL